MRKRFGLRPIAGLTVIIAAAALLFAGIALAVSGAVSTTDNPTFTGPDTYVNQACLNGHGVNCNLYVDKRDVWLSGLSVAPALGAGTYFFEVGVPGGQPDPNDAGAKNLSDTFSAPYDSSFVASGDDWTNREFTVDGNGHITAYAGTHNKDGEKLQVFPYDDTTNPGGVYILAVCRVPSGAGSVTGAGTPGVDPSDCKYDAFKVEPATPCTDNCGPQIADDLAASKDATPASTRTFTWHIAKNVDKTSITQTNGSPTATFNYTVTVNVLSSHDGGWTVTGNITVDNPNAGDASHVLVTDAIDNEPNAPCVVGDGSNDGGTTFTVDPTDATVAGGGEDVFPYTCTYTAAPANTSQTNTATVSWDFQTLSDDTILNGNSIPAQATFEWTTPTLVDDCINVTDTLYGGTLSSGVCAADAAGDLLGTGTLGAGVTAVGTPIGGPPFTSLDLKYSHTVTAPPVGTCTGANNTATFTTDDNGATGSASKSVTVCNYNAALTIGYWKNHLANSAKTGPWTDSVCKQAPTGTSCSSNGPWTKQFLGNTVANCCVVGVLSNAHATSPTTPGYSVTTITQAAAVFNANNCSNASTSDSNAAACLAAQLLGAELNVGNKANTCICSTIQTAITFLTNVGYKGPGQGVTFNGIYTRAYAITLKTALDNYNNGTCPA